GPEPREIVDLPEAVIRRRSEPAKLRIKPLWTSAELKDAGNIIIGEQADQTPHIYVFEGPRTVVEMGAEGKVVARHLLINIPESAAVTFARTATDQKGNRYFVASAPLSPQIYVFDGEWNLRQT